MAGFYFRAVKLKEVKVFYKSSFVFLVIWVNFLFQIPVAAQNATPDASSQSAPSPTASQTPIPFSDIIEQSDQATSTLTAIASGTAASSAVDRIERELPALAREAMKQTRLLVNNPCEISEADAQRLYETAW